MKDKKTYLIKGYKVNKKVWDEIQTLRGNKITLPIVDAMKEQKENTKKSSYELIGQEIGKLVDEKNKAYGDSFHKSGEILKIFYPNGIKIEQYDDMLYLIRIIDKQFRIATSKKAFGENPAKDIAGYSILKAEE